MKIVHQKIKQERLHHFYSGLGVGSILGLFILVSDIKMTSKFCFMYANHQRGGIGTIALNVDQSYEGKIILFPADLAHAVYPFYTSDDYRITMSGK